MENSANRKANALRSLLAFTVLFAPVQGVIAALDGWHDQSNFANSNREAYGWVCSQPDSGPLTVRFYNGSQLLGETTASIQREPAVAEKCDGESHRGFVWKYPESIKDNVSRQVTAKAVVNGSEHQIPNTPVMVQISDTQEAEGWFDFVNHDYMWGWACDPTHPDPASNPVIVELYDHEGNLLGYQHPLIEREEAVGLKCGGARTRSFQIQTPPAFIGKTNTIFAYATNAHGAAKRLIGIKSGFFPIQQYVMLGEFLTANSSSFVDEILLVDPERDANDGRLRVHTWCYGEDVHQGGVSWDPSQLTGLWVPPGPFGITRLAHQRGPVDLVGEVVIQAYQDSLGAFVKSGGAGYQTECDGLAGTGPGYAWWPNPPMPWPSSEQSIKGRELTITFSASVSEFYGISYMHPSLFFRDTRNNLRVWVTVQAFDSRSTIPDEFTGVAGNHPIVVTSFSKSGTRGRSIEGTFYRATLVPFQSFEYRLNGYQFERILEAAGCGDSLQERPCDPADYEITIAFVEIESATQGSEIGARVDNPEVKISQIGAIE